MYSFSIFTIRFKRIIEGKLLVAGTNSEKAFRIDLNARGSPDWARQIDIWGVISIQDMTENKPFTGSIIKEIGGVKLSFGFSDDSFNQHRFDGTIQGSIVFNRAPRINGRFISIDNQESWGEVVFSETAATASPFSSLRIVRKSHRPVFRDNLTPVLKRKSRPLPIRQTAIALAEAALPPGDFLEGGGEETIRRLEECAVGKLKPARWLFGLVLLGIEWLCRISTGRSFSKASTDERVHWLEHKSGASSPFKKLLLLTALFPFRPLIVLVISALKFFNINTEEAHERLRTSINYGVAPDWIAPGADKPSYAPEPPAPWETQVKPSDDFDADAIVEADAVVVGTGAGGGPVAKELAEKGFAVAIVEAGKLIKRENNTFGSQEVTFAFGNSTILLPMGKAVGGTTFINAGTCFRTPDDVLLKWADQGMPEFHPDRMAPYFDRVEGIIKVAEADTKYVGPVGEVIRRGCEKLGYHSGNLRRNAFECEGKAQCSQGCPHGAKQSTDKSYIPLALKSKASLFTGFKISGILTAGNRAIGIRGYGRGRNGKAVRLTVFAKAVILAAGALRTPVLIQKNGLVRGNRWVGRNLSFHPATGVAAIIPGVEMRTHECIPQGYCVDEFRREGLMFEGANIPLSVWALMQRGVGKNYINMVERFPNMACFGFMVQDTSRGRVRPGPFDRPFVTYSLNRVDTEKLVKGMAILSRIFFAAGARAAFGATRRIYEMRSEEDITKFEEHNWRPRDFFLSAYHCLGTARLGLDSSSSVTDLDHQCHSVPGLFVVDASSIPGSVGVNPQETIMAFATRAADRIAERLDR